MPEKCLYTGLPITEDVEEEVEETEEETKEEVEKS